MEYKSPTILESFALLSIVSGFYFFVGAFCNIYMGDNSLDSLSKYGDFVSGFSGVLVSLGAALLFYRSLGVQKKELELQREELKQTRKEFEKSNSIYEQQKHHNLLFQLYNSRREQTENIKSPDGSRVFIGIDALSFYVTNGYGIYIDNSNNIHQEIKRYYSLFTFIIKTIDGINSIEDKKFFLNMIFNSLYESEIKIITHKFSGDDKIGKYIKKFLS